MARATTATGCNKQKSEADTSKKRYRRLHLLAPRCVATPNRKGSDPRLVSSAESSWHLRSYYDFARKKRFLNRPSWLPSKRTVQIS